jgi:hypothetical protein
LNPDWRKPPPPPQQKLLDRLGCMSMKVFLAHHGFDHEAQVFGNGIAEALAHDLAGILDREFDFQVLVPVGVDLEFALTDPFGIIFVNVLDFKIVLEVEFFQSGPD